MKRRNFLLGVPTAAASIAMGRWAGRPAAAADAESAARAVDVQQYRAAAQQRWEGEIAKLDVRDKSETHPDDSVLFVGSSSIRLWDDIAADMEPYHPIQRGYGGAKWSDVAVFAERLIRPHTFRAAAFFVGNDISGGESDKSPAEVAGLFAYVLGKLREHNATAPVFYIAVTPTERRFAAWPAIKAANTKVSELCAATKNTHFIGTESVFFDAAGKPRPELFRSDKLHLSRAGYVLWAAVIKSHLDTVLNGAS